MKMMMCSLTQIIQKAYAKTVTIGEHFGTKVDYMFDKNGDVIKK